MTTRIWPSIGDAVKNAVQAAVAPLVWDPTNHLLSRFSFGPTFASRSDVATGGPEGQASGGEAAGDHPHPGHHPGRLAGRHADPALDDERSGNAPLDWPAPNGYPDVATAWRSSGTLLQIWNDQLGLASGWWPEFSTPDFSRLYGGVTPATSGAAVDLLTKNLTGMTWTTEHRNAVVGFLGEPATTPISRSAMRWLASSVVAMILNAPHHALRCLPLHNARFPIWTDATMTRYAPKHSADNALRAHAVKVQSALCDQDNAWGTGGWTRRRFIATSTAPTENTLVVIFMRGAADGLRILVPNSPDLGLTHLREVRASLLAANGNLLPLSRATGWALNSARKRCTTACGGRESWLSCRGVTGVGRPAR